MASRHMQQQHGFNARSISKHRVATFKDVDAAAARLWAGPRACWKASCSWALRIDDGADRYPLMGSVHRVRVGSVWRCCGAAGVPARSVRHRPPGSGLSTQSTVETRVPPHLGCKTRGDGWIKCADILNILANLTIYFADD